MPRGDFEGVNIRKALMDKVDEFIVSDTGRMLGMSKRPDFFETTAILFLAQYDKELGRMLDAFIIRDVEISKLVRDRDRLMALLKERAGH